VGDVIDADPAQRERARGGQRDLLVALAALHVLVGDRACAGDGVVVVALGVPLRPGGRAVAGRADVQRAFRVARLQGGRSALRADVEVRDAADFLTVVVHDRRGGAAGDVGERRVGR